MWRVNFETENTSEKFEADELDKVWYWISAGAFVMNVQRKRRHCSRKRDDSDRNPVIQTWHIRTVKPTHVAYKRTTNTLK